MSTVTINLPKSKSNNFEFFNSGTLNYFLPEICSVSETQQLPSDFTNTGFSYSFSMYLTHGVAVEFAFQTEQEAREARTDLITALSNYRGPDKLVFANGYDCEVAVVSAMLDVTDVFTKDGRSSFSATVDSNPYPINFIFFDEQEAMLHHQNLLDAIEIDRQQAFGVNAKILACV